MATAHAEPALCERIHPSVYRWVFPAIGNPGNATLEVPLDATVLRLLQHFVVRPGECPEGLTRSDALC